MADGDEPWSSAPSSQRGLMRYSSRAKSSSHPRTRFSEHCRQSMINQNWFAWWRHRPPQL